MRRHCDLLGVHMRKARLGSTALRMMQSGGELLLAAGTAIRFALGAYLLYGGAITIGTVYLVFAYADLLAWNVLAIATQLDDLQQAAAGIERIRELRALASALPDTGRIELAPGAPALAFENVSFSYANGPLSVVSRQLQTTDHGPRTTDYGLRTIDRCYKTSRSGSSRGACWACWGAPAAARPP